MSSVLISGDTSGSVTISAPAVSGSSVLTLPAVTDTLVGLAATQTMTNKSIVATQLTGTVAAARLPAGSVVQVVSVTKTDTFTSASTSFVDVTGLTASITPSSTNNKILVLVTVNGSQDVATARVSLKLLRDSTEICNGAAAGSRIRTFGGFYSGDADLPSPPVTGNYLDSPATISAVAYKIQTCILAGSGFSFINRTDNDSDTTGYGRNASTITLMEIAG